MTRATPWRLQGASFVAAQVPERDLVLCQLVAKASMAKVGRADAAANN